MTIPPSSREPVEDDGRPQEGPESKATLKLIRKEGHCILELQRGPGPNNMIWTQSAGSELKDALEKARSKWKFAECKNVSRNKDVEVWAVVFKDN